MRAEADATSVTPSHVTKRQGVFAPATVVSVSSFPLVPDAPQGLLNIAMADHRRPTMRSTSSIPYSLDRAQLLHGIILRGLQT